MDKQTLKRYMEAIYLRCYRVLKDREAALDATQEVMLKFYKKTAGKPLEQPLRYLYRSATNQCIDMMRRGDRVLPLDTSQLNKLLEAQATQPTAQHKLLVERLYEHFGEEALRLLLHRHVEQMTYEEIAALYDMSDRGMKKKIERIESSMRTYLR